MIAGEDRELFGRSLDHAVSSADVDAALAELGWADALVDDPQVAVSLLFERQGAAGATSGALDVVLASALGVEDPSSVAVVLPPLGRTSAPIDEGLATRTIDRTADALVAGFGVVVVADLKRQPVEGLDPRLGLSRVTVGGAPIASIDGDWADALAAGQRALAHELVGASRTMLELARMHALERIQFDQPIARFQAVRHKLAESLVAIETASSALDAAWDDGTPLGAAIAKAVAGRSARVVAKHSQQVLAGIGFTLEHDFHLHLRRVLTLDRLLGDAKSLTKAMGEELLRARQLPPMQPL